MRKEVVKEKNWYGKWVETEYSWEERNGKIDVETVMPNAPEEVMKNGEWMDWDNICELLMGSTGLDDIDDIVLVDAIKIAGYVFYPKR